MSFLRGMSRCQVSPDTMLVKVDLTPANLMAVALLEAMLESS
jgi:hypothetical protein